MPESYKPVVLIIRDGWGENPHAQHDAYNAVKLAKTPCARKLSAEWPRTELMACGLDVGLPDGIMGNSEVGHQNIGAGRVVDQEIVRINKGFETGSIKESAALQGAIENAKAKGTALHLMGLFSDAGVHSTLEHLYGLIRIAREAGVELLYVHAFTDGRDTGPFSGKDFIQEAEARMASIGLGRIASVSGRYWAMDRDNRWERVQRVYDCLTGKNIEKTAVSAATAIQNQYDNPESPGTKGDEFCPPTAILNADGAPVATIGEGDSVIFFNFRGDRPRELTRAFIQEDFDGFERSFKPDVYFVTLSEYQKDLCDHVICFKPERMKDILGSYVAGKGIPQFRCAETEKFPHVTFFFNDYREEPFPGEERVLVPSPKDCATYDEKPEMSAYGVRDAAVEAISSGKYGLVVVNFANPDMVGHTGVLEACIKACEVVDGCVQDLLDAIDSVNGRALITADHGNSDQLWNPKNDSPHTAHTLNPVEAVVYGRDCKNREIVKSSNLGDIAPTILELMELDKPEAMTGKSLLK